MELVAIYTNSDGKEVEAKLGVENKIKYYLLSLNGQITKNVRDGEAGDYDVLVAFELDHYGSPRVGNKSIKIYDRKLLPQLMNSPATTYKGYYGITSNVDDAFNVYKFVSDNCDVEWGLDGNKDKTYVLRTSRNEGYVYPFGEVANNTFRMHSHPETHSEGASGYRRQPDGSYIYSTSLEGKDGSNAGATYTKLSEKNIPMPKHFVYTVYLTDEEGANKQKITTIYEYDPWKPILRQKKLKSAIEMKQYVLKK